MFERQPKFYLFWKQQIPKYFITVGSAWDIHRNIKISFTYEIWAIVIFN